MKKRFLLITLMVALFVCVFAISINAGKIAAPANDATFTVNGTAYPLWEADGDGNLHPLMWYQDGDKLSSVWADNMDSSKAPYVKYNVWSDSNNVEMQGFTITDASGKTFDGKGTVVIANLNNIYLRNDGRGITIIHKNAFRESKVLKAVYIPKTIKTMGWSGNNNNFVSFENCSALEYVEFHSDAALTVLNSNTFNNCTSLKAISLPDNIKTVSHTTFSGCTALQAVYLPASLENFVANKWNTGAFYNCSNMYFVNEPFVLNSTCTNMPSKPEVYYFPESLVGIYEDIRDCDNINNVLVFGKNVVSFDSNMFSGTGTSDQVKTVVFTGVMTKFKLGDTITQKINFIFTNTTDTSVISTRTDRGYNGSTAYLCKAGKTGALHYGVKWTDGTEHFAEAKKTQTVEATCLTNKQTTTYCYCGQKIGTETVENSALGHEFNVANGATVTDIVYNSGFGANGYKEITCSRCSETDTETVAEAILCDFGYATRIKNEATSGLVFSYRVNKAALADYEAVNETTVSLGVLAVAEHKAADTVVNADGTAAIGNVVAAPVGATSAVDLIIWGSPNAWEATDEETGKAVKDIAFYFSAYVIEGQNVSYVCANTSEKLTDMVKKTYTQIEAEQA